MGQSVKCAGCGGENPVDTMVVRVHAYRERDGAWAFSSADANRSFICVCCGITNLCFGYHNPGSIYWKILGVVKHEMIYPEGNLANWRYTYGKSWINTKE